MNSLLKQKKISETPFRLEVLSIMASSDSAVSLSHIEKNLINYNRITLYRTIKTFVDKGIIHQIAMSDGDLNYALCKETCADQNHSHDHVHLKCKKCKGVFCVEIGSFPKIDLGNHQIDSFEIQAKGICENCIQA
jgi:Fur family transcriptional regulator, ferric uptake regulator